MAADVGADVRRADLALDELDSGKHRPLRAAGTKVRRPRRDVAGIGYGRRLVREKFFRALGNRIGIDTGGMRLGKKRGYAAQQRFRIIIAGARQAAFAENARRYIGAAQGHIDLLLDVFRRSLLDHQHGALADAEILHFIGHQRIGDVEHIDRNARSAVKIGQVEPRQRAQQIVGEAAEHDDADLVRIARNHLVELLLADKFLRRRQAFLNLEPFLGENHRRVREAAIFETRRSGEAMLAAIGAALIVFGDKLAGDVAGAHPQIEHHRRVARLGQLEAFFDHADDGRQIGPRIEQPDRGFHGVGVRALLDDAGALAKILAEHDQRAADHAGRRQVRQRIGRHIGADDGFPGHRAAQRIIDRGAEHGRGGGLVGAGLDMDAEVGQQILGIHHDVEQM